MEENKLAVIFPGIGYHKDKPLLYYSAKLAASMGYEVHSIEYHDMPQKIRGNAEMMELAAQMAYEQSMEQLARIQISEYDRIIFTGKSIGTVAMARVVSELGIKVRQIWYTPVEATFSYDSSDVIAFIGDADPWSDVSEVKRLADALRVTIYTYVGCNHSLECGDTEKDIAVLADVMNKTAEFLGKQTAYI